MPQVKSSNLNRQNEPRPMPRKGKIIQSTQDTDTSKGNVQGAKCNVNLSQTSSGNGASPEGIIPVKSFDETPISVTNKSFSQLLEDKLSDKLPANTASLQLSKPKKSFLRKGEGLAKFKPKLSSYPSSVPKCSVIDYQIQHKKNNDVTKNDTECSEPGTVKPFLRKGSGLRRFRLAPITGTRKNLRQNRKNSKREANNCVESRNCNTKSDNTCAKISGQATTDVETRQIDHQLKDTHLAVKGQSPQGTEREYDEPSCEDKVQDELEELRTFELLEQQAANSSFSSNCSFVGRILQISSQSSFNVNCYGTEKLQEHANFIPVDHVRNTPSAINTSVIKQFPEIQDPLLCTKQQIGEVASKIALLQKDLFIFNDDNKSDADDKTVGRNSCSDVANFIQRISHLQKSVEFKDCHESETDEGPISEENYSSSNILHRGLPEQMRRVLIDDLKEMKHCNSETESSFLSETLCVSITENPYAHSEIEQTVSCDQKSTYNYFESDRYENNKYSSVEQEVYEATDCSNKRVISMPDCKPSSEHFEKEYHHFNERAAYQHGDSEDLTILKSDLLHKRLIELDEGISIYNEEKLKLCALRKEYELIIQELTSEKEALKSLISKERAAIDIEREEIADEKFHLEQYKLELMKEKQVLEDLKQQAELLQNLEEREHQIQSEHLKNQYLIKRLQRENEELKEEISKLKKNENVLKKSGDTMKFIRAAPHQMNGLKKQDENPLEICDVRPKRCLSSTAHGNPTVAQLRKTVKGKREVPPVGNKKAFPKPKKDRSNKTKIFNAASNKMKDLGNGNDDNSLVIHEVVPRKPLPSAIEDEAEFRDVVPRKPLPSAIEDEAEFHDVVPRKPLPSAIEDEAEFRSTEESYESVPLQASKKDSVDFHLYERHAELRNSKLADIVPSTMKSNESREIQKSSDVCSISAQHFSATKTAEAVPKAALESAQNVAVAFTDDRNVIKSSLNVNHKEQNNYFETQNMQETTTVKKPFLEKANVTDFNGADTNSLPKHAAHTSSIDTGEISDDVNIVHDEPLPNAEIIPCKLHCADLSVASDIISSDRVTRIKTHPGGRKEIWYDNGCVCKISSDGMTEKIIYHNGDVLEKCRKSKTEKYYFCKSKIWCTTFEDQTQLVEFSNGQTELKKPDGTIKTNYINGAEQTVFPDGHVEWVLNDGRQCIIDQNGEKTWYFPNGQKEIHTKDHKRREYPDGTIKYVFPDGSMKTKYANGRIRVKDKDGKLVMDSHL